MCNGFQILTEIGLLPGALTRNQNLRFECKIQHVLVTSEGAFTKPIGKVWRFPHRARRRPLPGQPRGARAASRATAPSGFAYATAEGEVTCTANPNGAVDGIAGIYEGPKRNVFGLMPHPERMSDEALGCADGRELFSAVLATAS